MASKQQELKSVISVYGKADSSLDKLAAKIKSFGDNLSKVGTAMTLATAPVIAAVKQSTSLYTGYDDILRRIQAAGGYGEKQMQTIGDAARQAGMDTRYMAIDAASAFLSLTQAGVSLENSLDTLPTLLNAAAAGNMDLSSASDLLISNIYSLGKAFDQADVTAYMDKVVTAADASNTNVQEMMEGVSKIGAAGRLFAGGDSELLAFLGMLANLNMKGETGGVNARNMIISLLAPTQKAAKLMDALEISEEELNDATEGLNLTDSAAAMKKLGLETVEADGKVRPMIDILTDLKAATDSLSDDEKANVLYSMFGKRTYPAVMGLMELLGKYPDLLGQIDDAAGATARKAETLEGGIGGSTRTLKSAFEELQLSIGEAASDKVMDWMDAARGFLLDAADWIKGLDTETVNAFLDAVLGIAGTGATLAVAGKGISLFAGVLKAVSTPGGALALGAALLAALGLAITDVQDAAAREDMEKHFGALEIDSEKVSAWIGSLSGDYETAAESINGYADAVKAAGENYESYVQQFSGGILEAYLTQTELNEYDKEALGSYINAMIAEVKSAAGQQELKLGEIIRFTYDGTNAGDGEKANAWSEAIGTLFGQLNEDATAAGQNLMQVYLDAAEDGVIDADESGLIAQAQAKLNDVMEQIQSLNADIEWNKVYAKAMSLGEGSYQEAISLFTEQYNKEAESLEDWKLNQYAIIKTFEDRGLSLSDSMIQAYGLENGQDYAGAYAGLDRDYAQKGLDLRGKTDVAEARIANSYFDDYRATDDFDLTPYYQLAQSIISGEISLQDALEQADEHTGNLDFWTEKKDAEEAGKALDDWMETLSATLSMDELLAQIKNEKEKTGTVSQELTDLLTNYLMVGLLNGGDLEIGAKNWLSTDETGNAMLSGQSIGAQADLAIGMTTPEELTQKAQETIEPAKTLIEGTTANMNAGLSPSGGELALGAIGEAQAVANENPVVLHLGYDQSLLGAGDEKPKGKKLKGHALGGYADEPSIFGEAGGEWAIPEKKTERSRILLRRAAAGSGFTPEEIYPEKREEKTAMTFTFAPTIYAGNADGVKETLENERTEMMGLMDEWWNEKVRESERVSFA